jgi:hypothetical protein
MSTRQKEPKKSSLKLMKRTKCWVMSKRKEYTIRLECQVKNNNKPARIHSVDLDKVVSRVMEASRASKDFKINSDRVNRAKVKVVLRLVIFSMNSRSFSEDKEEEDKKQLHRKVKTSFYQLRSTSWTQSMVLNKTSNSEGPRSVTPAKVARPNQAHKLPSVALAVEQVSKP